MFTEMSRFILFGKDAVARKPTIASALTGTGQNGIRRMFGLKPLRQHTLLTMAQTWHRSGLPSGLDRGRWHCQPAGPLLYSALWIG